MSNPKELSKDELIEKIVECAQILDAAPIPEDDRMIATDKGIFKSDGTFTPWEEINKE